MPRAALHSSAGEHITKQHEGLLVDVSRRSPVSPRAFYACSMRGPVTITQITPPLAVSVVLLRLQSLSDLFRSGCHIAVFWTHSYLDRERA